MDDGREGWDWVRAEARAAAQVCVSALRRAGYLVPKGRVMEEALAELFLPALRVPRERVLGVARSPESAIPTGGSGKGQDDSGVRPQSPAEPEEAL